MKHFRHILLLALLVTTCSGLTGCDATSNPAAMITGIDIVVQPGANEFIEIQDGAGRAYARVESFPAAVDVPLYSAGRDYFIVLIGRNEDGTFRAIGASNGFKTDDLTGVSYTTSGGIEAVLTLQ